LLHAPPPGGADENRSLGCGFFICAGTVASPQHSSPMNCWGNLDSFRGNQVGEGSARTNLLRCAQEWVRNARAVMFANSRDMDGNAAKLYSFKRHSSAYILRRSMQRQEICTILVRNFPG
jgi:hypothetical protein